MLYELIDMTNWKTKDVLIKELSQVGLKVDERKFRAKVKGNNERFFNHQTDIFIAHSNKGYKATKDAKEILDSVKDNHKRSVNMLYEEAIIKKALGENYNFHLEINEDSFTYLEKQL